MKRLNGAARREAPQQSSPNRTPAPGALEDVGGLWRGQTKKGEGMLSGKIDGKPVLIFKNGYKEAGDSKPDYRVYRPAASPAAEQSELFDDSIPF